MAEQDEGNHKNEDDAPSGGGEPLGHDAYLMHIIESQASLHAYILSLTLDRDRARDLLQQVNLVLLEKEHRYTPGTNFGGWACRVAFYEVLADRRTRQRDRHTFSDDLLSLIAADAESEASRVSDREAALRVCLEKLPSEQSRLIVDRYEAGASVSAMAEQMKKTPGAVSAALHRTRVALMRCVENQLRALSQ